MTSGYGIYMDPRQQKKINKGDIVIDLKIDLHGMTVDEAHTTLNEALAFAADDACKYILVVHGKGLHGKGELKQRVPSWLRNDRRVQSIFPAQPKHGGDGAVYVLLRQLAQ